MESNTQPPDDGELDLTSDPSDEGWLSFSAMLHQHGQSEWVGRTHQATRRADNAKPRSIRMLFQCCNVYYRIPVPQTVLQRKVANWRIHCPRCGRTSTVPV